jgi:hypothetical protein
MFDVTGCAMFDVTGCPMLPGGENINGFDCSGCDAVLVKFVFFFWWGFVSHIYVFGLSLVSTAEGKNTKKKHHYSPILLFSEGGQLDPVGFGGCSCVVRVAIADALGH